MCCAIIGTAGHVDHGKTSLVKALTGIDCDTHKEEKQRGLTINPGYAYLRDENTNSLISFVDVPGHQKFINNMICAASGIHFLMLVVAADDAIMPQTIEHLKICSLLGIKDGLVVINKCDKVSAESIQDCLESVQKLSKGTFLESKPIFKVSALTGQGIEELKSYILKTSYTQEQSSSSQTFRLFIDRAFIKKGRGLIVTGLANAALGVEDKLILHPCIKKVRVRAIQQHQCQVSRAVPATRVAIDIAGAEYQDISSGSFLASQKLEPTSVVDVKLESISQREFKIGEKLRVNALVANQKREAYMRILSLEGANILAQLYFLSPCYLAWGDKIIIRDTSVNQTLAGGQVIDPLPLTHRRISKTLITKLKQVSENEESYMLAKIKERAEKYDLAFYNKVFLKAQDSSLINSNRLLNDSNQLFIIGDLFFSYDDIEKLKKNLEKKLEDILINDFSQASKIDKNYLLPLVKEFCLYVDPKLNSLAINLVLEYLLKNAFLTQVASLKLPSSLYSKFYKLFHKDITLPEFKAATGISRKNALIILEHFRSENI